MTHHHPDPGSASDWSSCGRNLLQPIIGNTQIWVVMRHQNGISVLVSQTPFSGETSGDVAKCQVFPQVFPFFILIENKDHVKKHHSHIDQ